MSIRVMEAAELLSLNKFNVDEEEAHIVLDKEICSRCQERPCLLVCPAYYTDWIRTGILALIMQVAWNVEPVGSCAQTGES